MMLNININKLSCAVRRQQIMLWMLLTLTVLTSVDAKALEDPGGLDDDPGQSVPVDGGLSLLLGAGVCYGVRQMKTRARQRNEPVKDRPGT
jgi:hypothetical protein